MSGPTGRMVSGRRRVGDRGSTAVYAAILAPGLFACVMLFVNAVARWDAWRDATDASYAAARAAAQPDASDYGGGRVELGSNARSRAQAVLDASGYSGTISIGGDRVVVTVTADVDYVFPLAPFGSSVRASGHSDLSVTGDG